MLKEERRKVQEAERNLEYIKGISKRSNKLKTEADKGRRKLKEAERSRESRRRLEKGVSGILLKQCLANSTTYNNAQQFIIVQNYSQQFTTVHNSSQQFTTVHNS